MKAVFGTIGALAVLGLLIIGSWQLGWWASNSAEQHRTDIRRSGFERQDTLANEVLRQAQTVAQIDAQITTAPGNQAAQLHAQRIATVSATCRLAAQLEDPPVEVQSFTSQECS
jgi:hypothetical protein